MSVLLDKLKERHKEYILVSETLKLMSQANENCPLDHVKTYLLSNDIHYHMPVFYLDDYFRLDIDPSEESIRNFDGYGSTYHELTNDKISDNAYFLIESLNDFEPIQEFDIFAYERGYHYIANQSVGKFTTGEKVIGLTEDRAIELLKAGAIQKRQINNENVVRQSKAPPPPNHINIAPTFQKTIDKVIEAEKRKEAILPNGYQQMTMLYDYFTPHQACCFIAGLHPSFNGRDDDLEIAEAIIEGGFKSGKLIADDDQQIKSDNLKLFLYSKNWIMNGFNDNLTDDTHSPNKETAAYQKRIADLEQQLSKFQAAAADVVTIPFGKRLDFIDKNLPQSERIEKSYELYGVGFYEDKHPVNTPDEMIKRIQGLLKVIRDKDSKISELEKQTNTPNNAQDKIDELENQLSQIKAELATAPADDKELPSNSQAGVARMLYAILTEHGYDLSPMKGKGVANDMIVSAANTHGTSVTRNFVADWLIRAREVKIKNT